MKSGQMTRLAVVRDLLELARPLNEIATQLARFNWNYEGRGLELTGQHISVVLQRYLEAKLLAKDVELWANLIEARDDVCIEASRRQQIDEVLYELANPTLTQSLDKDLAGMLIQMLV